MPWWLLRSFTLACMTVTTAGTMWDVLETESPRGNKRPLFRFRQSLTRELPSFIPILRSFSELNRIHWQSPTYGGSAGTAWVHPLLEGLVSEPCKREPSPPGLLLGAPRHPRYGYPSPSFFLPYNTGGQGVEFLPNM